MIPTPSRSVSRRSLAHWISVLMLGGVLAATLAYLVLVELFARDNATRTAGAAMTQIAWQMRDQLDRGMSARYEAIEMLVGLHELRSGSRPDDVRALFDGLSESYPRFSWLGYVDRAGEVLVAKDGLLEGRNVSERPWFLGAVKAPYVGDVHPAVLLEQLLPAKDDPWRFVDVAMPIRGADGAVTHVLGAHLSWDWARDLARTLMSPSVGDDHTDLFVVDRNGQVLLGPRGTEGKTVGFKAYDAMRAGGGSGRAVGPLQHWSDGVEYVTALAATQGHGRYAGLDWIVVARQPKAVAFAEYHRLRVQLLAAALLVGLLSLLVVPWAARRLTAPLRQLTEALDAQAKGEQVLIAHHADYREAQRLSSALAAFAQREREHLAQVQQANEQLEQRIEARTAEVRQREQELRTIIEQTGEAFIRLSISGEVIEWNLHAVEIFGWQRAEALGRPLTSLLVFDDRRALIEQALHGYLETGQSDFVGRRLELTARHKDGHAMEVEAIVSAITHNGQLTFNALAHDIAQRKRADAQLRESRERLRAVTDNIPALVAEVDRGLCFSFANQAYRDWFHLDPASLTGQPMSFLYGEEAVAGWSPYIERVWEGARVQFERTREVEGKTRHEQATYIPRRNAAGQVDGFYALVSDQTPSKEIELRLQNEAAHDALTGLPNRRHLMSYLPQAMSRSDRLDQALALLFLDLNGFKAVNDTHGHEAGDQLLQQVAQRLQQVLRKGDSVVRLAGDEFVVLLEPIQGEAHDARRVIDKINEALEVPFVLQQATVRISVSSGVSFYQPGSGRTAQDLLSGADAAMYEAKKQRGPGAR